jgi:beta-galactosidase
LNCRDYPSHSGQFLWTGIDYLGEARRWPRNSFSSGLIDRTGRERPLAYQRKSWWSEEPVVRIARRIASEDVLPEDPGWGGEERFTQVTFSDWTPRSLDPHGENVEVYSNCEEVELLLNGQSLGVKSKPENAAPRVWRVEFEPGKIEAVGRNGGTVVALHELRTAGAPEKIALAADRKTVSTDWNDVVFVRATVTDAEGIRIPRAADQITFEVGGPGEIVAVDNGDCNSVEPFQTNTRKAYFGTCIAIIRATGAGTITVTAKAEGLAQGSVNFRGVE